MTAAFGIVTGCGARTTLDAGLVAAAGAPDAGGPVTAPCSATPEPHTAPAVGASGGSIMTALK